MAVGYKKWLVVLALTAACLGVAANERMELQSLD